MKTILVYFAIVFGLLFQNKAYSQQGKSDATFNVYDDGLQGDGFDNTVRTVSLQTDSKLIVGGDYLNFNGAITPYLCRLFQDGSKDTSFNLGTSFNGKVYCSLIQPDGKIILGGSFTTFNGISANRLIRLNSDGSIDATFNTLEAASSGIIYGLALQTNGSVVIVGSFTKYNGITANRVARILPNGNLDAGFITGSAANGIVEEVQIQPDGKIVLAGSFDSFNGISKNKIIRLNTDGSPDTSFVIGSGFNAGVSALVLQPDGKIIAGGDFVSYNGITANKIVRLNLDGSIDVSFVSGIGFNGGVVEVIKLNSAGAIMVGGSFTGTYNGLDVNRLTFLSSNGILDPIFDIGAGPFSASVLDVANASDDSWYVGGSFSIFDSQNQGRLAKVDPVGTLDIGYLTAGVGFDNSVLKVLSLSDNKTMAFGSFTKFNGTICNRISRLSEDGSIDSSFNMSGAGANNTIRSAIIQTDNKMVLAGAFITYNGVIANRITRILPDGLLDPTFITGLGSNSQIYALALQPDGKIIIAGNFTSYNGILVNRIARLLPNGILDLTFNTGLGADAIVEAVLLQPDGKILLGGRFATFNGVSYNRMIRLNIDGSIDSGFSVGIGFDKNVYAMTLQSDNKLIVGGTFLSYGGASAKRILRLNSNGSIDNTFTSGAGFSNGEIRTILVQPDDRILLGGTFSGSYNGIVVKRMLRLLSSGVYDTTFSVNLNGTLFSTCFTSNNKIIIGGSFNSVSGITKHRVARLKLCTNSSVWNGIAWSNGLPSVEKTLIFNSNYASLASVNSCSCSISTGNTVTVPDGNTLGLVFDYSGSGTLVLENNAALYQSEEQVTNTGVIQLKRKTTPILKTDYTYWSSPVLNQKLIDVSPNTPSDKFYSFDASLDSWFNEISTTAMTVGKGYIIRGPESFSDAVTGYHEAVFIGVPNNGLVSIPIGINDTSNLIGNPYPSAIDANLFINANNGILDGTIYFWTHNTAINNNLYTSDDYAVYNSLGGVGTSASLSSGVNNTKPDGKIASAQAFFVTGINGGGMAKFNNNMRMIGQNSSFFKLNTTKKTKTNEIERHRIWLDLYNSEGAFKQILLGYATGATDDFDSSFDGESFNGNEYLDFYSIIQDKNLVIQGRALPFQETDEVKLGFTTTIAGAFTIKIDQADELLARQNVFVEDKSNNRIVNLKNENFTFNTAVGIFNDRFVLRFTDKTLALNEFERDKKSVLVFNENQQLQVNSTKEFIDEISIYDLAGRKIYERNNINEIDFSLLNLVSNHQALLINIVLQNGHSVVRKVVY
ncbi:T9SS sorting signal type C domain-containing protein [Flavobacterium yafengii]|uniref:T9SS sorting signal type C domain-containing protein n=1 Tax=Flavobacterium yafengii TaxID=3041253 RepID=UPI0024A94A1D|nr:T9SS sorting signal type C domain-containing protein [Flavobacterium yafengii]MDI5897922.1 T9SS sorting signal type C domain-containing protein [Flavobacterium yafengii]MDI6045712.1 T9SS sorting signal type C domain-containing protein [Flavobacterium yafengii]